ncbi:hypothetical protein QBE52_12140 [Clostridiaceae bacterium 35-E11]
MNTPHYLRHQRVLTEPFAVLDVEGNLKDEVGRGFDFNAAAFFYEDEKDPSKKANVVIDRITGDVTAFDLEKATEGITYQTSPY